MARIKTVTFSMIAILILAVTVIPLAPANVQFGQLIINVAQENVNLLTAETGTSAIPNIIACGGCSGGSIGPG